MKYIIYCRKSTDTEDKQVLSLESQENEMLSLAQVNGLEVKEILRESRSAKTVGRPVFRQMMDKIRNGDADGIICWKLDRLARNMVEGGEIMDALQNNVIKEIRTYANVHTPSETTLMLAVHFGMANQYSRDLSENVKRGNRAKLERGEWPSHAPIGYLNDKAKRTIVVDTKTKPAVVRCFELYASGTYSLSQVFKTLNAEGYRTTAGYKFGKSKVEQILKNPFYYGVMYRDGKYYQGKHTPLISKAVFDKVQDILSGKARPKPQKRLFPLRGILTCELCSCQYTATLKKGHQYYYCTNGKGVCEAHRTYLRSEVVNELTADALHEVSFEEELIELMYEAARERYTRGSEYQEATRERLQGRLQALEEQELKAFEAFSANLLRPELYERKMQDIKTERMSVEQELRNPQNHNPLATLERTKNLFLQGNKARKEFLNADDPLKRNIAFEILWNLSLKDGNVAQRKYQEQYQLLADMPKDASFERMSAL